ncbi:MAG: 16S rRNA processing protein RimM [Muribaculaceae bacterium]|nr:16S rRNA processing protein RimM [Muribaculaceae bacterium]
MITRDQLIVIGRYNKPHGVNGEISATLDLDVSLLQHFKCLISDIDGIFVPFFMNGIRAKNAMTALLVIDGINDEVEASLLVNKDIYVLKSEYEALSIDNEADDYPLDYFIGFTLIDDGREVGEIIDVDDTTENVLFEVKSSDGNVVQVPAVDDLVEEIHENEKKIVMNLPDGLLTL